MRRGARIADCVGNGATGSLETFSCTPQLRKYWHENISPILGKFGEKFCKNKSEFNDVSEIKLGRIFDKIDEIFGKFVNIRKFPGKYLKRFIQNVDKIFLNV